MERGQSIAASKVTPEVRLILYNGMKPFFIQILIDVFWIHWHNTYQYQIWKEG